MDNHVLTHMVANSVVLRSHKVSPKHLIHLNGCNKDNLKLAIYFSSVYDLELEPLFWIPGIAIGLYPLGKIFDTCLSATQSVYACIE